MNVLWIRKGSQMLIAVWRNLSETIQNSSDRQKDNSVRNRDSTTYSLLSIIPTHWWDLIRDLLLSNNSLMIYRSCELH